MLPEGTLSWALELNGAERKGWSCQNIRAGQREALCGNTSPASADLRKTKLPAPAFCFGVFPFFNLGYNILDDLNPQGFLD